MKVFDLHCDTLYKAVTESHGFSCSHLEVQTDVDFDNYLQCFAVWIPDNLTVKEGRELLIKAKNTLPCECNKNGFKLINSFKEINTSFTANKKLAVFTLENCKIIDGDLSYIEYLAKSGIKIATLTWNDNNCIGGGALAGEQMGLTGFGRKAIPEFEKQGIIIDVSHASDRLFYDVCDIATKPFIATHSNSRAVTAHRRNLTDEQAKIIFDKGGIIGLNFHNAFLNDKPGKACLADILNHAEHFLSLGGEDKIAIGSDFDGGNLPSDIENNRNLYQIYNLFLKKNYSKAIIDKIFYENAVNFFENFDI